MTEIWDDLEPINWTPAAGPHPLPHVPCGHYQILEPGGSTVTVRIRWRPNMSEALASGPRWFIEWLLSAQDNTWDPFGWVTADAFHLTPRANADYKKVAERLYAHLRDGELFEGWDFAREKPVCARCGRLLKDVAAEPVIHKTCAKKWGM